MYKYLFCEKITFGREAEADIRLDHASASRLHAVLQMEDEEAVVYHLGRNGIRVNGRSVMKKAVLSYGDRIELPGCVMVYLGGFVAVSLPSASLEEWTWIPDDLEEEERAGFHRAPRPRRLLDDTPVRIAGPPSFPSADRPSVVMLMGQNFMLALPMLLGSLFMVYAFSRTQGRVDLTMYAGLVSVSLTMVFSFAWAVISARVEAGKEKGKRESLETAYREYLNRCNEEIRRRYEAYRRLLHDRYPGVGESLLLPNVWNRDPADDDYWIHRLGIGNRSLPWEICVPEEGFAPDNRELWDLLNSMKDHYAVAEDVPVLLDLSSYSRIGIIGEEKTREMVCAFLLQIGITLSYTDVKVVFIGEGHEQDYWDCLRWMPHCWNQGKTRRYLAFSRKDVRLLCAELMQQIEERRENDPAYLIIVRNPSLIEEESLYTFLNHPGETPGIHSIWISEKRDQLPHSCQYILELGSRFSGGYAISGKDTEKKICFDRADPAQLDSCFRKLSGITLKEERKGEIPDSVTYFEMCHIEDPEEYDLIERWEENRVYESVRGLIGVKEGGTGCYLDLHEKYHGPHGLIAGMTGSGKSEMLQTLILSLAMNYSPEELNIFLIDYKGGGMSSVLEGLPHICGEISNLSEDLVHRAMLSVKSENTRRQKLFRRYRINSINEYSRMYREGQIEEPLPHLLILIDEFAELKKNEPGFMKELISVAQVGRSLGVHLLLSTQKPAGTVDENIWSNSRFRICLRVQDRQDSMDMLHTPDASLIRQVGRGYLQVGNNERYELFQSGWSTAPYEPGEQGRSHACLVHTNGDREGIARRSLPEEGESQMALMIRRIRQAALEGGYRKTRQLWSQPLPAVCFCDQAAEPLHAWLGCFDDPARQSRHPFCLDFETSGHILVCGISMSGKSTLVQTILYTLCEHSPVEDIHLSLVDFGGGSLHVYEMDPHVGDYISEEEEERTVRLIKRMHQELQERRKHMRGVSFSSYRSRKEGSRPYLLLVIDGLASFYRRFESLTKQILDLVRFGANAGILILATTMGIEPAEMPADLLSGFQTRIGLAMKDRYGYGELFGLLEVPVFPQKGISGRGIALCGDRILEFQTGLCTSCQDELARLEEIESRARRASESFQGVRPARTRTLPRHPDWKGFSHDKRGLCAGYDMEEARPLPLEEFFCLLVSGSARKEVDNAMCFLLASCLQEEGTLICLLEGSDSPGVSAGRVFRYASSKEEVCALIRDLARLVESRQDSRGKGDRYYIFLCGLDRLLEWIYEGDMADAFEHILEEGERCRISIIAGVDLTDSIMVRTYPAWSRICSWGTGIHMGGVLIDHPFASGTDRENLTQLPSGQGHYIRKDGMIRKIMLPEMRKNDLC